MPCHRSHIDHLLLSYVLYHQGLVPPHIAAGTNLNFWPVGRMFQLGAFFIRRTFKGNRLYSAISFREYLSELFSHRGYSAEYFIEGAFTHWSFTYAKNRYDVDDTSSLAHNQTRPISVVPVYVGYEHVLEVDTYAKELCGAAKEKEKCRFSSSRIIKKLRNLGQGFVTLVSNTLSNYLSQHFLIGKSKITKKKPQWFAPAVDSDKKQAMVNINKAAAVNAMNSVGTALMSSRQRALSREQL